MKTKYAKKDKRIKKSKTPKNAKKIVSKKKAARRLPRIADLTAAVEPPVTLGFEVAAAEPEQLADRADEAAEPTPDVEVTA